MSAFPIEKRAAHPLKLKALLQRHAISQVDLSQHVLFTAGVNAGKPLSTSAINQIINWNHWSQVTPPKDIRRQVTAYLTHRGVPDDQMKTMWELDEQSGYSSVVNAPKSSIKAQPPEPETIEIPEPAMLTEPARHHFKLFKHPFVDDVQGPDDVYLSADQRYIRETMYQTARLGGFVAIVGESGSGKTTLRRDLLDRIRREGSAIRAIQPQVFDKTRLTAAHLCDAIIADLSDQVSPASMERKARLVSSLLTESSRAGNSHVLIIEEAHDLHISTLKYLKRFWELEDGFKKLVSIILVGQSELGERLDERRNPQAREVIRRCEVAVLQPLNGNLEAYLAMKFKRVGKELNEIFEPGAFDAIRQRLTLHRGRDNTTISFMYPLIVHNVVIKAMNQAAEVGEKRVTSELVLGV